MKKVKCISCGEIMEYDGDAWHCNNCSMIALDMGDGEPTFCDDELEYGQIGYMEFCPECNAQLLKVEKGHYVCTKCGEDIFF